MKKDIETIDKSQEDIKNTISELKNTGEGIKSRLDEAGNQISELDYQVEKNSQTEQQYEIRLKKDEEGLQELQDNMKPNNIHITGMPEGQEEEQGIENVFEKIVAENFPNLMREKFT